MRPDVITQTRLSNTANVQSREMCRLEKFQYDEKSSHTRPIALSVMQDLDWAQTLDAKPTKRASPWDFGYYFSGRSPQPTIEA